MNIIIDDKKDCVSTYKVNNKLGNFIIRRCLKYVNKFKN